uniref:Uncharacterized protein n=1 Tax=Branchiostoma floridae TaxID=7739 RepID=C3YXZ8_BRAFL|eukprot:XP_002598945.1 hypothetical protein BRAFLDRAFT_79875 [Branchiostoma floridae]
MPEFWPKHPKKAAFVVERSVALTRRHRCDHPTSLVPPCGECECLNDIPSAQPSAASGAIAVQSQTQESMDESHDSPLVHPPPPPENSCQDQKETHRTCCCAQATRSDRVEGHSRQTSRNLYRVVSSTINLYKSLAGAGHGHL